MKMVIEWQKYPKNNKARGNHGRLNQGRAKVGLQLWIHETQFTLVLLFINTCILFHTNNSKLTFAPPCIGADGCWFMELWALTKPCRWITAFNLTQRAHPSLLSFSAATYFISRPLTSYLRENTHRNKQRNPKWKSTKTPNQYIRPVTCLPSILEMNASLPWFSKKGELSSWASMSLYFRVLIDNNKTLIVQQILAEHLFLV